MNESSCKQPPCEQPEEVADVPGNGGRKRANRRAAVTLMAVAVAMFGFGYALLPLYDLFCEVTGLGGRTATVAEENVDNVPDASRLVTVEFLGHVNAGLPWDFAPVTRKIQVHPGQIYEVAFTARNRSAARLSGQAVPRVVPATAGAYFSKTECFCFTEQSLEGGQRLEMPVRFVLSKDLPADIRSVTLSYTFFGIAT